MRCIWIVVLCLLFLVEAKGSDIPSDLAIISHRVNMEYSNISNNCLLVAVKKQALIGRGEIKCKKVPKQFLPIERHCYLVVDDYILDNGGMREFILD